jgi:FKBP-type peptidyl-prolyl cis-trans isomerase SlyD
MHNMKIAKNTVVTVNYKLSDAQDNLIEDGRQPMVYLHGGYENTLPKIEEELDGKEVGYSSIIQIEPEDAFGDYDASLVKVEERNRLPEPLEVGMQFEGMPDGDGGEEEAMIFTVTDIADDKVVLDGNHPLAGMALRFSLEVVDVREASDEEIAHGHVHGAHGHHHDDEDDEGEGRSRRHPPDSLSFTAQLLWLRFGAAALDREQGGGARRDAHFGPICGHIQMSHIAAPLNGRLSAAGAALRVDQQHLPLYFSASVRICLRTSAKPSCLVRKLGSSEAFFRRDAGIAVREQHDALHLLPLRQREQAVQPCAVGHQAVFKLAVAARLRAEVVVVGRQVDGGEQHLAVFPVGVLGVAAELGVGGQAGDGQVARAEDSPST